MFGIMRVYINRKCSQQRSFSWLRYSPRPADSILTYVLSLNRTPLVYEYKANMKRVYGLYEIELEVRVVFNGFEIFLIGVPNIYGGK